MNLHGFEELLFLIDGGCRVKLVSLDILLLTEVSILEDDVLALVGSPGFVIELLLLVRLAFHELGDEGLTILKLHLAHELLLVADESSASLFSLFSGFFGLRLLGALLQTGGCEGKCSSSRSGCGLRGSRGGSHR